MENSPTGWERNSLQPARIVSIPGANTIETAEIPYRAAAGKKVLAERSLAKARC